MRDLILLLVHVLATLFRLACPGGPRSVVDPELFPTSRAESTAIGSIDRRIMRDTPSAETNGYGPQSL